jgi:hypothetical protein
MMEGDIPRTLKVIGNICNIPDRQRSRRFVDERSYLIRFHGKSHDKYILKYYVPMWMRDFFFDPIRSRYLYSTSLVLDECQKAIKHHILDPNPHSHVNFGLVYFFTPTSTSLSGEIPIGKIANATHLLESARNGPDKHELLLFLKYLYEIHWFDIYHRGRGHRDLTNRIVRWVSTTLVG